MMKNILILLAVCAMLAKSSASTITQTKRHSDLCGVPNSRSSLIVYGQSFFRGKFPWIVALMHTGTDPPQFFCSGTLISKTSVISAAHCFLDKQASKKFVTRDILAVFGAHDLTNQYETERYALTPKEICIHDEWNHLITRFDADVSLLKFEDGAIHFNKFVHPICLWHSKNDPNVTEGVVTGWGRSQNTSRPHENLPNLVKAMIQTNEDCFLEEEKLLPLSSKRTFCAGLRNGSGVCVGDSGAGLFIEVDGVYYLRGIVSSSVINGGGCDVWKNAVYTNVLKFDGWIKDTITPDARKVFCRFLYEGDLNTCEFNQTIAMESFMIGSPKNTSVERCKARANKELKFLPKNIGEKFPNLKELLVTHCGLMIIRDFYFKNMGKLEFLHLSNNQITAIEPKAFDDLVSLRELWIDSNLIETLDEKLFVKLVNLKAIGLVNNNIKLLSPTTFKIPGGKLGLVNLRGNVCLGRTYGAKNSTVNEIESDINKHCMQ